MAKRKDTISALRRDAVRWRFCLEHGFPRRCFNPPTTSYYWYVSGFDPLPECLTWDSPIQAVEAAIEQYEKRKRGPHGGAAK